MRNRGFRRAKPFSAAVTTVTNPKPNQSSGDGRPSRTSKSTARTAKALKITGLLIVASKTLGRSWSATISEDSFMLFSARVILRAKYQSTHDLFCRGRGLDKGSLFSGPSSTVPSPRPWRSRSASAPTTPLPWQVRLSVRPACPVTQRPDLSPRQDRQPWESAPSTLGRFGGRVD